MPSSCLLAQRTGTLHKKNACWRPGIRAGSWNWWRRSVDDNYEHCHLVKLPPWPQFLSHHAASLSRRVVHPPPHLLHQATCTLTPREASPSQSRGNRFTHWGLPAWQEETRPPVADSWQEARWRMSLPGAAAGPFLAQRLHTTKQTKPILGFSVLALYFCSISPCIVQRTNILRTAVVDKAVQSGICNRKVK